MQRECGGSSIQERKLPAPRAPKGEGRLLSAIQPWDLRGTGQVHCGSHSMDFLEMVTQDPEGGTFQILPRVPP